MIDIAVITPYHREPKNYMVICHDSVRNQQYPARHILVADGHPDPVVAHWGADHIVLPYAHDDIGSTPRAIGALHAVGAGFGALAFLDADNWMAPNHIISLLTLHQETGASVLTSGRYLCRLDGSLMGVCPHCDGERFVDTNCMMFMPAAFHLAPKWALLPSYAHLIGDRVMLHWIKESGLSHAHLAAPTVFYRCGKEGLYRDMAESVPPGVAPCPDYESAFQRWEAEGNPSVRPHQIAAHKPVLARGDIANYENIDQSDGGR